MLEIWLQKITDNARGSSKREDYRLPFPYSFFGRRSGIWGEDLSKVRVGHDTLGMSRIGFWAKLNRIGIRPV
jgi:hypothetical protein